MSNQTDSCADPARAVHHGVRVKLERDLQRVYCSEIKVAQLVKETNSTQ